MTISFPLSLPTTVSYRNFSLAPQNAQARGVSPYSLKEQIYNHSGEKWRIQATYPPLTPTQAKDIIGCLVSLRGGVGTFLAGDPKMSTPVGSALGSPTVNGAGQQGTAINTAGWNINQTGVLKRGDLFQLENYLYMVLQDADSNGSGQATFDIFPRLRGTPANGATITTSSPKGLFRLESESIGWATTIESVYEVGFTAIEAI